MSARWAIAALVVATALPGGRARAHDFSPGVLSLVETTSGGFDIAWTAPVDSRRSDDAPVRLAFVGGCRQQGARLECGEGGLRGAVELEGAIDERARVVITIQTLGGEIREAMITGASPRFELARDAGPSLLAWIALGIEHIVGGLDHVAFLAGLLLLSGLDRRVVITITAFTVAHSLTLALAALDVVRLPSAPVEASIAASIVLVAREGLWRDAPTLARRAPWMVALLFGLVHGLGFAGALRDIGLPEGRVVPALIGFNAGVELGQLALVAVVVLVVRGARARIEAMPWARPAACYALGTLGAWWLVERTAAIVIG